MFLKLADVLNVANKTECISDACIIGFVVVNIIKVFHNGSECHDFVNRVDFVWFDWFV